MALSAIPQRPAAHRVPLTCTVLLIVLACATTNRLAADTGPLDRLRQGNERYVAGQCQFPNADAARRADTGQNGQKPFATVLACADSRVPVENLLDQGIGDVFVIRVAGNVADTDEIGSIEYGVGHLHTPLLVVLGHTKCGAVTAVVENAQVHGHLPALIDNIIPAVTRTRRHDATLEGAALVSAAIRLNIWQSIQDILTRSAIVREAAEKGEVAVVGALYNIETGAVEWLGEHPDQARLLASVSDASEPSAETHDPAPAERKGHQTAPPDQPAPARDPHSNPSVAAAAGATPDPHAAAAAHAPNGPSPVQAYQAARAGNSRFVLNLAEHPNLSAERRKQTASEGQKPFVTVLACSDSRVPVEMLLDQGIGDVFVVRVAGNVADTDELGTIEYGVGHLHTPLLVILGHSTCGAVTAVAERAALHGYIPELVDNIRPAVEALRQVHPELKGKPLVEAAVRVNVWQTVLTVLRESDEARKLVQAHELMIVGGIYHLDSGEIEWLGEHPQQAEWIESLDHPAGDEGGAHAQRVH